MASTVGSCVLKQGDIYINQARNIPSPFKALTWPERVEVKHNVNIAGVPEAAPEQKSFIQLQKSVNSNLEIPG